MQKTQLYVPEWISLPQETRAKLVEMFNLKRDVGVEVVNNTVVCDGYSNVALSSISIPVLQEYTKLETEDFMSLFSFVLESINPKAVVEEETVTSPEITVEETITSEEVTVEPEVKVAKPKTTRKTNVTKN
jgi:hypothetical protein